jgi:hypothetical protein
VVIISDVCDVLLMLKISRFSIFAIVSTRKLDPYQRTMLRDGTLDGRNLFCSLKERNLSSLFVADDGLIVPLAMNKN